MGNQRLHYDTKVTDLYSMASTSARRNHGKYSVVIAMSGGGTRAAALSYGVLKALKEVPVKKNEEEISLLEEVDFISAVSGGSFTAAYYGLFGDKIFTDFEKDFLYAEVGKDLFWRTLNPRSWLSSGPESNRAISYYQKKLFKGATFADFDQENSPLVIINATDLGGEVRFSFTQEYFNLLCSNISSYPVANAVAASSAVPIVFDPVVLKNHTGCGRQDLLDLNDEKYTNDLTKATAKALNNYSNKEEIQYVHLVDGGITDNLGLLAMYDFFSLSKKDYFDAIQTEVNSSVLAISVNASTTPTSTLHSSPEPPGIVEMITMMTDVQIHRLNDVSKSYYKQSLYRFGQAHGVKVHFVDINLSDIADPEIHEYMNNIPTDMQLDAPVVDSLIEEGIKQLNNSDAFKDFLNSMD
ncbi:patatin-like phospholipase family protein [Vibrio hannami]|uniref:patatin-like phospholipase family protein n=1 Tax=Vibrio hannami TaxID=2717094 RepID=UPI002410867F|nr:patatin-like phospholipase family protein [Vibrio hannami]MDG3088427.1 patatin-like phospholipase family protein [Vibrio hannami]